MARVRLNSFGPNPPDVQESTVILDKFGTGTTFGYEASPDGRWCAGEPVSHNKTEQTSTIFALKNRFKQE